LSCFTKAYESGSYFTDIKVKEIEDKEQGVLLLPLVDAADEHSEKLSEKLSQKLSQKLSEKLSQKLSEKLSEKLSKKLSKKLSEKLSDRQSDKHSNKHSNKQSENHSDEHSDKHSHNRKGSDKNGRSSHSGGEELDNHYLKKHNKTCSSQQEKIDPPVNEIELPEKKYNLNEN
jgi:hypothetical protein